MNILVLNGSPLLNGNPADMAAGFKTEAEAAGLGRLRALAPLQRTGKPITPRKSVMSCTALVSPYE